MSRGRVGAVALSVVFVFVSGFTLGRQYGEATPSQPASDSLVACERVRDYANELRRYSSTDRGAWDALVRLATEHPTCGV